jgi:hypothetical protein
MRLKQTRPIKQSSVRKNSHSDWGFTDDESATIYWNAILKSFPNLQTIMSELINANPEILPICLSGAPSFMRIMIEKRLQQDEGGPNEKQNNF